MSVCANYRRVPASVVDKLEDEDFSYKSLSKCEMLDLDKSWDSLHLFLTGGKDEDGSPLSKAIHGGSIIGEMEDGQMLLTPEEVAAIDRALQKLNGEECAERMRSIDPDELEEMEVYSMDCDSIDDAIEEAHANFDRIKKFYGNAAKAKEAVLVSLG